MTAIISGYHNLYLDRDSSVGIAIRYGQDRQGIECRQEGDSLHPSRPALGLTQSSVQWVPRLFHEGKAAGAWRKLSTRSSAEVKERINLYFC